VHILDTGEGQVSQQDRERAIARLVKAARAAAAFLNEVSTGQRPMRGQYEDLVIGRELAEAIAALPQKDYHQLTGDTFTVSASPPQPEPAQ
jgi:hypothetical protein